ncbi:MAG: hypothetical protein Q9182_002249 [Xanthomendoza sp. 2 TL-2023]
MFQRTEGLDNVFEHRQHPPWEQGARRYHLHLTSPRREGRYSTLFPPVQEPKAGTCSRRSDPHDLPKLVSSASKQFPSLSASVSPNLALPMFLPFQPIPARVSAASTGLIARFRLGQPPSLAVTEASFQSLQLSDTSLPPSYSTSNQYPSRGSYGRSSLSASYLTPGYDAGSYASSSPSGSYLGSQRGVSPFAALEQDPSNLFDTDLSAYSKPDMSYSYHRAPVPSPYEGHGSYSSSRSPSMHDYAYVGGDAPSRRTPSTSSSYDLGGSSGYARTSSASSAPYLSGVSGSSNPYGPSYPSSYGVGDVGSHSLYPSPSARLPSNVSTSGSYRASRQPSLAPSISPHPDDSIRIVENPRKPQCFDHGCNGRQFSTFSNLLRHQREKSGTATKSYCPRCGAEFTRTTARNGHMAHDKCKPRPQK